MLARMAANSKLTVLNPVGYPPRVIVGCNYAKTASVDGWR